MPPDSDLRCPQCGQSAGSGLARCTGCRASLLVDVLLARPTTDARERFTLAKELWALGALNVGFAELQDALETPHPLVARQVTRAFAARCVECAELRGVLAGIRFSPSEPTSRTPPWRQPLLWVTVALVCLALASALQLIRRRASPTTAVPVISAAPHSAAAPAPSIAEKIAPASKPNEISQDVIDRTLAATVAIRCPHSVGAGFFITEHLVLTNAHVACAADELMKVVLSDGRTLVGVTRSRDDDLDLALVEASGSAGSPLELGDAAALRPGERVAAVGSPHGLEFSLNLGAISHVGRNRYGVGYLQVDINVNPGNSGGPVVDASGRAVGVMSMMVKGSQGLGLALPVNYAVAGDHPVFAQTATPIASSAGWKLLTDVVAEQNARDVEEARRAFTRPGLVAATSAPDGTTYGVLLQRSASKPAPEAASFRVERAGTSLCAPATATPRAWNEVTNTALDHQPDPRLFAWLKKNQLDRDLYAGLVEIRWTGCHGASAAEGAELVLENAEPSAVRVPVVPYAEAKFRVSPEQPPSDYPSPNQSPMGSAYAAREVDDAPNEQQWRHRFQEAHQRIADVDQRAQEAKRFIGAADGAARNGVKLSADEAASYERAKKIVDDVDSERATAQSELDDLERRASREAVPREWRR